MDWIKRERGISSKSMSSSVLQGEENSSFAKDMDSPNPFGNVSARLDLTSGYGFSLTAAQAALSAKEEPPVVSTNYLEITERLLKQGSQYQQRHESNSRTLVGTHVTLGSEQHPESVKDFLDAKRRESVDTLIRSEENFSEQKRKNNAYLTPDVEWEKFKEKIVSTLLAAGNDGVIAQLRNQRLRNSSGLLLGASGNRQLSKEELQFAQVLVECNDEIMRTHSHIPNLADRFRAVIPSFLGQTQESLWDPLVAVVTSLRDESHAFLTQDQTAYYRLSENFNRCVITAARRYLEKSALMIAEEQARNPVRDFSFDTSKNLSAVVDYTRLQISKSRLNIPLSGGGLYGVPVWALLYYAVRLGTIKTAVKLCEKDEEAREFARYLVEYERNGGSLLASSQLELQTLYRSQATTSTNPDVYKKSLLAVLSRSETELDLGSVTNSVSDWLWIKLAQTEPAVSSSSSQVSTLAALQQTIRAKFPSQKTSDEEAFLAFILTGQFELAIERLFLNVKLRFNAVAMAICLKQVNLLLFSLEPKIGTVVMVKEPFSLLDFASVIQIYVDGFRKQRMDVALEYFFHVSDSSSVKSTAYDHQFQNLFEFCVYKLAKDTGRFVEVFGEKLGHGNRQKQGGKLGLLSRLCPDPSSIVQAIAQDLIQDGRLADGLTMLELANQASSAFRLLLKALSDGITFPNAAGHRRDLQQLARNFVDKTNGLDSNDQVAQNLYILLDLLTFLNLVESQEYRKAIIIMQNVKLLPMEQKSVKTALAVFRNDLLPEVKDCIPFACLQFMHALVRQYSDDKERILATRYGTEVGGTLRNNALTAAGARLCDELINVQSVYRKQARAILEYANQIPSSQLPDVVDLLIKLESTIS